MTAMHQHYSTSGKHTLRPLTSSHPTSSNKPYLVWGILVGLASALGVVAIALAVGSRPSQGSYDSPIEASYGAVDRKPVDSIVHHRVHDAPRGRGLDPLSPLLSKLDALVDELKRGHARGTHRGSDTSDAVDGAAMRHDTTRDVANAIRELQSDIQALGSSLGTRADSQEALKEQVDGLTSSLARVHALSARIARDLSTIDALVNNPSLMKNRAERQDRAVNTNDTN